MEVTIMEFKLQFNMDNAAFEVNPESEIETVLHNIEMEIRIGNTMGNITDYNGNPIGKWEIEIN